MTVAPPPPPAPSDDGFGTPTYSGDAPAALSSTPDLNKHDGPDLTKHYMPQPPSSYPPPPPSGYAPPPRTVPGAPPGPTSVYDTSALWNAPGRINSPFGGPQMQTTVPPVAWLAPVAAVMAIIGVFTPWFRGIASLPSGKTQNFEHALYSWKDGKIGLLPPILLTALAIGVVGLLRGRTSTRFHRGSSSPLTSAARGLLIGGVVSAVCLVVAWFLVPTQYKFDDGTGNKISWNDYLDKLHAQGLDVSFSRGPQIGYWLTIAAAALAVITGLLLLVMKGKETEAPPLATPPVHGLMARGVPGQPPAPYDPAPYDSAPYGQAPYGQAPYGQAPSVPGSYGPPPSAQYPPPNPYSPPGGQTPAPPYWS